MISNSYLFHITKDSMFNSLNSYDQYDGEWKWWAQIGKISLRDCFEGREGAWSLMKDLSTAFTYKIFVNKSLIVIGGSNELRVGT